MIDLKLISLETKIRKATQTENPSPEFTQALWDKMSQQPAPSLPERRSTLWQRHPARIIIGAVLVLILALFIGFGPQRVSAVIKQFFGLNDSGLQSVQDAGLITELDITAQPTFVPDESASTTPPPEATLLSDSQTLEGVTLTLDWVYVDEGRLALSWTTDPLPNDLTYTTPTLTFKGFTPPLKNGSIQSLRGENNQLIFVSYQVIQVDIVGDTIDFSVDLPLVHPSDPSWEPVANFHFDLQDIPVFRGKTVPLQQTYTHQINGVEIRLKSIQMMPSYTEMVVCYDFPTDTAPFWYMQHGTLQIGDGPEESYRAYQYLSEIQDDHCAQLGFGVGSATEADQLIFRVHDLVVPLTIQDELPAERIYAANETLAERGIEIAPAPAEESEGPGGWVFVRNPGQTMRPEDDPGPLVIQALTETMTGPWVFYVDLPDPADFSMNAIETPEPTPALMDPQS